MKVFLSTSLLMVILLLLHSCGLGNSPEKTANEFMTHLTQENYDAARAISTQSTHKMLGIIQAAQSLADDTEREAKKKVTFACNCEQEGEVANCDCCENGDPKECTSFNVVKEEGNWLVDMKKEGSVE